jgi:hypothetical protein
VRRVVQHPYALAKSANDDVIFPRVEVFEGPLKIPNTTVDDLRRGTRSGPTEIAGFNQHNVEASQSRIKSTRGANCAASNNAYVESVSSYVL